MFCRRSDQVVLAQPFNVEYNLSNEMLIMLLRIHFKMYLSYLLEKETIKYVSLYYSMLDTDNKLL